MTAAGFSIPAVLSDLPEIHERISKNKWQDQNVRPESAFDDPDMGLRKLEGGSMLPDAPSDFIYPTGLQEFGVFGQGKSLLYRAGII